MAVMAEPPVVVPLVAATLAFVSRIGSKVKYLPVFLASPIGHKWGFVAAG